jgi:hypothetical protein
MGGESASMGCSVAAGEYEGEMARVYRRWIVALENDGRRSTGRK